MGCVMITMNYTEDISRGPNNKLHGKTGKIIGSWGCTVWWLIVNKQLGYKVFTKYRSPNKGIAAAAMCKLRDTYAKISHLDYVPEVLFWTLLQHTGQYTVGLTALPEIGTEVGIWYPVALMPRYKAGLDIQLPSDLADEIYTYMLRNGIELHYDFRSGNNAGKCGDGSYVILDITTVGKEKLL